MRDAACEVTQSGHCLASFEEHLSLFAGEGKRSCSESNEDEPMANFNLRMLTTVLSTAKF